MSIDYKEIANKFIDADICACALMGSRARRDNGIFSDIDFLRIIDPDIKESRHRKIMNALVHNILASISTRTVEETESWFQNPVLVTETVQGLRDAEILYDPKGIFRSIQNRANDFSWKL